VQKRLLGACKRLSIAAEQFLSYANQRARLFGPIKRGFTNFMDLGMGKEKSFYRRNDPF
jgi:hypothetical protein